MTNELDQVKTNHGMYKALAYEGRIHADISARNTLPFVSILKVLQKPDHAGIYTELVRSSLGGSLALFPWVDAVSLLICGAALFFGLGKSTDIRSIDDALQAFFFLSIAAIIIYTYTKRRYSEYVRYMLYTDKDFFDRLMSTPDAVRLYWIQQDNTVPASFSNRDFKEISRLIQNNAIDMKIPDIERLRESLKQDDTAVQLFSIANTEGFLYASASMDPEMLAAYKPLNATQQELRENILDLYTYNETFYARMNSQYSSHFSLVSSEESEGKAVVYRTK